MIFYLCTKCALRSDYELLIDNFINLRFIISFFLPPLSFRRLRIDNNGGAWCPKHMVSRNLNEYLQIDLLSLHAITSIKTQGRFGKGQGQEFTEAYVVEYWRSSFGSKWKRWKNIQGKEVSKECTAWDGLGLLNDDEAMRVRHRNKFPVSFRNKFSSDKAATWPHIWASYQVAYPRSATFFPSN